MMWSQAAEGSCLPSLVLCVKPSAFRPSNCPFPHISLLPTIFRLPSFSSFPALSFLPIHFLELRHPAVPDNRRFKLRVPSKFHRRHRSGDIWVLSQSRPIKQHPNITASPVPVDLKSLHHSSLLDQSVQSLCTLDPDYPKGLFKTP